MGALLREVKKLQKQPISKLVKQRLSEFSSFKNKPSEEWFSELCFCLLTANSKAQTACNIQAELGAKGFLTLSHQDLVACIRRNKHRFHNIKAGYIVNVRPHIKIKEIITTIAEKEGVIAAREWLVKNIKGYGYKESSHFLRNVGYFDVSILDRHILNLMKENGIIRQRPPSLNQKNYLKFEKKFLELSKKAKMLPAELDMYMWYMKAGDVLK